MRFRLSRRTICLSALAACAGAAVILFLLIGPPKLLARSESPEFCASCHVMEEQHTAWRHSGAHSRSKCVDCHLPNGNTVEHYVWKSIDGMKDLISFHTGMVPEPITLSAHGKRVVQANCARCHEETVCLMDTTRQCWSCHRQMRHRMTRVFAYRGRTLNTKQGAEE